MIADWASVFKSTNLNPNINAYTAITAASSILVWPIMYAQCPPTLTLWEKRRRKKEKEKNSTKTRQRAVMQLQPTLISGNPTGNQWEKFTGGVLWPVGPHRSAAAAAASGCVRATPARAHVHTHTCVCAQSDVLRNNKIKRINGADRQIRIRLIGMTAGGRAAACLVLLVPYL